MLYVSVSGFGSVVEEHMAVIFQSTLHDQSDHTAGKYFTDANRQHHKRNRKCHTITVTQYERNDDDIRNNRWKCCDNRLLLRSA